MSSLINKLSKILNTYNIIKIFILIIILVLSFSLLIYKNTQPNIYKYLYLISLPLMFLSFLYEKKNSLIIQLFFCIFFLVSCYLNIQIPWSHNNQGHFSELILTILLTISIILYFILKLVTGISIYNEVRKYKGIVLTNKQKEDIITKYCKKHNLDRNKVEFEFKNLEDNIYEK